MWKAYADRGYAVSTTFERIQSAFEGFPGVITGGEVTYVDFARDGTELGNTFTLATTKDMPYRDEKEFRLFFWKPEPRNEQIPLLSNGVRIPVDVRRLIAKIYVSPLVGTMSADIADAAKGLGIDVESSAILTVS